MEKERVGGEKERGDREEIEKETEKDVTNK